MTRERTNEALQRADAAIETMRRLGCDPDVRRALLALRAAVATLSEESAAAHMKMPGGLR